MQSVKKDERIREGIEEITERDRAVFEVGIKLGALYHQFIGTPLNSETADALERIIERSVRLQPFVKGVSVKIDREKLRERERENGFGYCELQGDMLKVRISVVCGNIEVHACLNYKEDMMYPLMQIDKIIEKEAQH